MSDAADRLLYVGQSCNLRQRLNSYRYIHPDRHSRRMIRLVHQVRSIAWEICPTPSRAIVREEELLRRLRPRFNRAKTQPLRRARLAVLPVSGGVHVSLFELATPVSKSPAPSAPASGLDPASDPPAATLPDTEAFVDLDGCFFARRTHAALARLMFAADHQATSIYQIPVRLMSDRFRGDPVFIRTAPVRSGASDEALRRVTGWLRAESIEFLVRLWDRLPPPDSVSPFHRRWQASEFETLLDFALRRNPGLGQCSKERIEPHRGEPADD